MAYRKALILLATASALAITGCQSNGSKEAGGTVLGAAAGGLLGAQVGSGRGQLVGTALGALIGSALGAEIGRSLDYADKAMARWNEGNGAAGGTAKREVHPANSDKPVAEAIGSRNAEDGDCPTARRAAAEADRESARRWRCGRADGSWQIVN